MRYWEIVNAIMRAVGSSREDTERFVQKQDACVEHRGG
jgi:hypothetical protein